MTDDRRLLLEQACTDLDVCISRAEASLDGLYGARAALMRRLESLDAPRTHETQPTPQKSQTTPIVAQQPAVAATRPSHVFPDYKRRAARDS